MDSNWLEALVKKFGKENRISRIVSIETESAVPKGQNYASIVTRCSMSVILGSGRKTTIRFIIKEARDPTQNEFLTEFNVFKCETMMYQNVLKEMEVLMNEFGDTGDTLWANMLGYKPYTSIVLNDLTTLGYRVAERRNCLNLDHGLLVIRSLAKFHAMSKILIGRGIVAKEDLPELWAASDKQASKIVLEGTMRQISEILISSWPSMWKPMGIKIQEQIPNVVKRTQSLFQLKEDGFHVVNHGDPWTCNMMFKYSPFKNDPVSFKFLDFQICHYNSYIFDFIYFVYSSIIPEVRRKHIDELLHAYQEALEYYLKSFSYKGKIPNLDDVKAEHQRAQYWSFLCLLLIHSTTAADESDALDLGNLISESGQNRDFINPKVLKSEKLINGIGPDIENYVKNCVI